MMQLKDVQESTAEHRLAMAVIRAKYPVEYNTQYVAWLNMYVAYGRSRNDGVSDPFIYDYAKTLDVWSYCLDGWENLMCAWGFWYDGYY